MSSITPQDIKREFFRSKMGIAGIIILGMLIITSIITIIIFPVETFQEWNNPSSWMTYPKTAMPVWINLFVFEKIPEHKILMNPSIEKNSNQEMNLSSYQFSFNFEYDQFPNDFIYSYTAEYINSPLLEMSVIRPDGIEMKLISTALPYSNTITNHKDKIFSTDAIIKKELLLNNEKFSFQIDNLSAEDIIFSKIDRNEPLKGNYVFLINLYEINEKSEIVKSNLIIGGKAFGIMGTDELRRDLAIGLLWGTPLALFIGLVVSIASVVAGLVYGVYSGFKGKKTDEALMRFNDVIYALPALPFLIILSVTISNSIFVMIGFLMIFGWVGIAKVARSMSLQIKTRGYVEAATMMGQKDSKMIFKHILPQLLPYAFASVAISVPAAITTEAGLSFLGLGDPSFPTWGQILHDANIFGAAARGLWWWIVPPGIMIAITGLAFVFIGNALDAIINPKLKK
ncbi:ABC transporter permease [Nitrosopumilus sp.]|nr:ABC transporter permease [Nitrosopumilus sp.]MDB4850250.1 ABC transporter permease [Nitrosopumilus sp.]